MQKSNYSVERVTKDNYHMYYDMVSWRMKGVELTKEEKEITKKFQHFDICKELEHSGFYVYAALCDGRFVGWVALIYIPKISCQRWERGVIYVDELWIAPEYRRKGIATQLMKKVFDCQKETDAVEVRLYVGEGNIGAEELYKKCGLRIDSKAIYMRSNI
jgi:GNAT superfamily N-acetyltransferase